MPQTPDQAGSKSSAAGEMTLRVLLPTLRVLVAVAVWGTRVAAQLAFWAAQKYR